MKNFPTSILTSIVFLLASCRTADVEGGGRVKSSADRDERAVEAALKSYSFELRSLDSFLGRVDPAAFFENLETKQHTDFVMFGTDSDARCSVGLTTEVVAFLRANPHVKFTARATSPGRTAIGNHSDVFFGFRNDKMGRDEEFLASCNQPVRRLTIADVVSALGEFIRFRSMAGDTPRYDVCCACKTDYYQTKSQSNDVLLVKDELSYLLMDQSTDSICGTTLLGKKNPLRPGDRHFRVSEERYEIWSACEDAPASSCAALREREPAVNPAAPADHGENE